MQNQSSCRLDGDPENLYLIWICIFTACARCTFTDDYQDCSVTPGFFFHIANSRRKGSYWVHLWEAWECLGHPQVARCSPTRFLKRSLESRKRLDSWIEMDGIRMLWLHAVGCAKFVNSQDQGLSLSLFLLRRLQRWQFFFPKQDYVPAIEDHVPQLWDVAICWSDLIVDVSAAILFDKWLSYVVTHVVPGTNTIYLFYRKVWNRFFCYTLVAEPATGSTAAF